MVFRISACATAIVRSLGARSLATVGTLNGTTANIQLQAGPLRWSNQPSLSEMTALQNLFHLCIQQHSVCPARQGAAGGGLSALACRVAKDAYRAQPKTQLPCRNTNDRERGNFFLVSAFLALSGFLFSGIFPWSYHSAWLVLQGVCTRLSVLAPNPLARFVSEANVSNRVVSETKQFQTCRATPEVTVLEGHSTPCCTFIISIISLFPGEHLLLATILSFPVLDIFWVSKSEPPIFFSAILTEAVYAAKKRHWRQNRGEWR